MTRQLYGEEHSSSLWRPLMVAVVVAVFCLFAWITTATPPDLSSDVNRQVLQESAVGPGRDQRGCLHTAGYVWCEGVGKCVRPWQDSCPGGTEFCRSFCSKGHQGAHHSDKSEVGSLWMEGITEHSSVFCRCTEA